MILNTNVLNEKTIKELELVSYEKALILQKEYRIIPFARNEKGVYFRKDDLKNAKSDKIFY